jgi:hypothetical protein
MNENEDRVDDETINQNNEFEEESDENFSSGLSTDEIIAMYENVDISLDEDDIISVEDIIKIYETSDSGVENFPMKKTSRNLKNKRFQNDFK